MATPTQDEIVKRIEERKAGDMFGFEWHEYMPFLDFDRSRPFMRGGVTREQWAEHHRPLTREAVLDIMLDYMGFAWDKANNCRGISANRSVMHYIAWTWLAGDADFSAQIERMFQDDYCHYGKPILWVICKKYGWDFRQWDDSDWTIDEGRPGPSAESVVKAMGLGDLVLA